MFRFIAIGGTVLMVGLLASCASQPENGTPHWVHDQQIRAVMNQLALDVETGDPVRRSPPGVSYPRETIQAFDEASTLAEALAESTDTIECLAEERDMPEADRAAFLAQVDTLRTQAHRMNKMAASYNMQGVQLAFNEINATCNACHTRFRDYAGALR
jgi:cytochrome c556